MGINLRYLASWDQLLYGLEGSNIDSWSRS